MYNLVVLIMAAILMSCSSLERSYLGEITSPGYQYGKQLDERSMKAGFMDR